MDFNKVRHLISSLQNQESTANVELVEVAGIRPKLRPVSVPFFDTRNIFKVYACIDKPQASLASETHSHLESEDLYSVVDDDLLINEIQLIKDIIELPIEADTIKRLAFNEQLVVSLNDPVGLNDKQLRKAARRPRDVLWDEPNFQALGGHSISIESYPDYFRICVASQFSFESQGAVNSITSAVNYNLNLMEEKRSETLTSREEMMEKCLNVEFHNGRFQLVQIERNGPGQKSQRKGRIANRVNGCLVQDGGAFLLMRYLVLQKFVGYLWTYFMHISGELCRSCFRVYEPKNVLVYGKQCMVTKVKRIILRKDSVPEKSISMFMATGHMIRHCWPGYPYLIHINPLQVAAVIELIEQTVTKTSEDDLDSWKTDIYMYSRYLSMKGDRIQELWDYARSQPQAMALIRDYVHCLLRFKPENVLDFTIKHFTDNARDNVRFSD